MAYIQKAKAAFVQLKNRWRCRNLSIEAKIPLFNTHMKSVLLYRAEIWRTAKLTIKKIQTFLSSCLRRNRKTTSSETVKQHYQTGIELESPRKAEKGTSKKYPTTGPKSRHHKDGIQMESDGKDGPGQGNMESFCYGTIT